MSKSIISALFFVFVASAQSQSPLGAHGQVGFAAEPKKVTRLEITKPGLYENYLVEGGYAGGNLVKITAENVVVRHCEIRCGSGNGIGVFATNVLIANCRIHHMLSQTFAEQHDAHGISGRWGNLVVSNCDISYVSGDCIQLDPDRRSAGSLRVENCTLWTGPLPANAAGFKAGQRPGENAIDTKTKPDGPRCQLVVSNCVMHGWNQPAQIANAAALNLKENVDALITHCALYDNEICFRLRGPGKRGGAHVQLDDCAVYDSACAVRAEDRIEQLQIRRLGFGQGLRQRITFVNGPAGAAYQNTAEHPAPPLQTLLESGFQRKP